MLPFLAVWSLCWLLTNGRPVDDLPHCSRNSVMEGEVQEFDDYRGMNKIFSAIQLSMSLHETACISLRVNNSESSVLHTLEFLRLEQHHPISGKYQFAIPRITPSCICDCAGGDEHCKMEEYNYKNCTSGPVCYRTFHPVQSNVGCLGEAKSDACCQLKIEPYKDWTFTAIRISQPDTILIFSYRIFEKVNKKWRRFSEEIIEVPMNKGSAKFNFKNQHRIEMTVTGSRPNREVTPGMYFVRDGTSQLRTGVPLNDLLSSDLGRLGWLRMTNGKWAVANGPAKIKEKYHIDVQDCKAQVYTSTFNGEQVVLVSDQEEQLNFNLGQPLSDDPWIKTASVSSRVVRVEHAEGTNIMVHMTTETRPVPISHASQFDSFDGKIQLDKESNRFFNVTLVGTKGTIFGKIFESEENKEETEMAFSIQVDSTMSRNYQTVVALPLSINGRRYVCMFASNDEDGEQCQWVEYEAENLESFTVKNAWQTNKGECFGCNERGVEATFAAFDPRSFLNGINSTTEAVALLIEIASVIVMILLFVLILTKCIIPLLSCTFSIFTPATRKR